MRATAKVMGNRKVLWQLQKVWVAKKNMGKRKILR